MATCLTSTIRAISCRDTQASPQLKLISVAMLTAMSISSISAPLLLSRFFYWKPFYGQALLLIKCFAAGVILSISLVHLLPNAFDALSDCQVASSHPWKSFPWAGVVPMVGMVVALLVDLLSTSQVNENSSSFYAPVGTKEDQVEKKIVSTRFEMGIVGWHDRQSEEMAKLKERLVERVLAVLIVFYPVILGVVMGISYSQCTLRSLIVALALYQAFEGIDLGSCMAQAGLSFGTTAYICFAFSVTAPIGTVFGMIVNRATNYPNKSPNGLIMEGVMGSLASGILLYVSLIKFTSTDFFHSKVMMGSRPLMKKLSYIALLSGCASMSTLLLLM